MNRDRIILLIGSTCFMFAIYYVISRLMAGDAIREDPFALLEPSSIKVGMKEIGELERSMADDLKLLTADDCVMIELQSLAIAKLANEMRVSVPEEVAIGSKADWVKLLNATIESARKLANLASDGDEADGQKVFKAYRELTETCLICHKSFGIE